MFKKTSLIALFIAAACVMPACSPAAEGPSDGTGGAPAGAPAAQAAPAPRELTGEPMTIAEQMVGDLAVALVNETGMLQQGANYLSLEFRRNGELVDVGGVQVQATIQSGAETKGALMSTGLSTTAGRYNIGTDLTQAGTWKFTITLGSGREIVFDVMVP